MEKSEIIARAIARRTLLRALGVMRPQQEWGSDFTAHIERAIERTYPDHLYMAEEIRKSLASAGF